MPIERRDFAPAPGSTRPVGADSLQAVEIAIRVRRDQRWLEYSIEAGVGLTALFGPSGAGKTTLLDAVAGLVRPASGRIAIGTQVLFDSALGIDLPPSRRRCGYVFQDLRLFPHRSVRDNLLFGARIHRQASAWMSFEDTCGFLGITHLLDRRPATLSGGEAQRVAIGRALLSAPRFLLMDEPLASVDAQRRDEVLRVIERLRDEVGLPILYVSHDHQEVERLADRIVAVPPPSETT